MNLLKCVAKLVIIIFYMCVLLLASNKHGKSWEGSINFWVALAVVTANFVVLSVGGFFTGFLNFGV